MFSIIIVKLLKNEFSLSSFVYRINVPKTMLTIPKYWENKSFSFKNNKENKELKIGVRESRGIVKLKSEWRIDFKKKNSWNHADYYKYNSWQDIIIWEVKIFFK